MGNEDGTGELDVLDPPDETSVVNRWARLWRDPVVLGLAIGAVVLTVALVVVIMISTANHNVAVAAQTQRDKYALQIESLEADVADLSASVAKYKPVYTESVRLDAKEKLLDTRETVLEQQRTDARIAAEELAAREDAVKAREDAATALANAADWWVNQVRECLARAGSYRSATVTDGRFGRDFTCYTN